MRTIDHISAESEALQSVFYKVVDGVQFLVGAGEFSRFVNIQRANLQRFDFLYFGIADFYISECVMMELVAETFVRLAVCNINVAFALTFKFSADGNIVVVFHCDFLSFLQLTERHL